MKASAPYSNMWLVIKINAEIRGVNPILYIIIHALETLAYTIPGFIIVLMFPIKAEASYGWFSGKWHGIWQGWFGLCNLVIRQFSPDTLFIASNSSLVYYILWWGCFIYAIILLLGIFILPFFMFTGKKIFSLWHHLTTLLK